jgi:hypothetical protein
MDAERKKVPDCREDHDSLKWYYYRQVKSPPSFILLVNPPHILFTSTTTIVITFQLDYEGIFGSKASSPP